LGEELGVRANHLNFERFIMNSSTASQANFKNYVLVTLTYWGFTITDGALRLLVLLYFNNIGYTPIQIASLFLFYEVFGVVTNFLGGWIGSQLGLKVTLYTGISLQIFSLIMLSFLNPEWAQWLAVLYVMIAQAFSCSRVYFCPRAWAKSKQKLSSNNSFLKVPKSIFYQQPDSFSLAPETCGLWWDCLCFCEAS